MICHELVHLFALVFFIFLDILIMDMQWYVLVHFFFHSCMQIQKLPFYQTALLSILKFFSVK